MLREIKGKRVILNVSPLPTTGESKYIYHNTSDGFFYYWNDVSNSYIKIEAGSTYVPFKNLNEWHVDPNGNDTTGNGSQEKPYLTIAKALTQAGQGDEVIVHAGVYTENVTISTPNIALVGAQSEWGSLSQINGSVTVSASGTSVKISYITVVSIVDTGSGDLYLNKMTVGSTVTSSAGYLEINNSRIQDATITKSAGSMLIENTKIDNVNVSGTNTSAVIRDSYQDGNSTITFGAGTIYGINNVQGGEIVINASAVPLETAALAQGLSAEMAKEAETADFQKIGMLRPDTEANPTKVVTWDEVTGRLEVSNVSDIKGSTISVTFGTSAPTVAGVEGDEYFITSDGTSSGTITAQYIYDATTSTWILRPTPQSKLETTSLIPKVYQTNAYVNAKADTEANVADLILLSDGTYLHGGKVTWTAHGLTVGAWYYLSQSTAGAYTTTRPTSGLVQQLFFVEDANTIHVDIEEAWNLSSGSLSFTKLVYFNSTDPSTATIFDTVNPPTTNDDALKNDTNNLYIGTDGKTWNFNGSTSTYNSYTAPPTTEWYYQNTTTDAGADKTNPIWRPGQQLGVGGFALQDANATLYQSGTAKGLTLTGTPVQLFQQANGARWVLGVNLTGNVQHWFGDYNGLTGTTINAGYEFLRFLHIKDECTILDALGAGYARKNIHIGQEFVGIGGQRAVTWNGQPLYNGHIRGTFGVDDLPDYSTATKVLVKNPTTNQVGSKDISSLVPTTPSFAKVVYFNSTNPSTATIFDLNNPPVTNDNSLKAGVNNLYIGTDGSNWTYKTSTSSYSTYVYPATSPLVLHSATNNTTSVVQASQTIRANYSNNYANSFGTSWNPTTGVLTIPRTGYYDIEAQAEITRAWSQTDFFNICIFVNGVNTLVHQESAVANGTYNLQARVTKFYYFTAGQTLDIRVQCTGASNLTSANRFFNNYLIVRSIS